MEPDNYSPIASPQRAGDQVNPTDTADRPLALDAFENARGTTVHGMESIMSEAAEGLPSVEITDPTQLRRITDSNDFLKFVAEQIESAKAGEPTTFHIDTRVTMLNADGLPIPDMTQAFILQNELTEAFPERAFVFSKPDLNPGDPGYAEFPAPQVTQEGLHVSTKENAITTVRDITLADGTLLPAESKFAVGTVYDGSTVRSLDPSGIVWATTPDGNTVQVAGIGQSIPIAEEVMSADPRSSGQVANMGDHLMVRTTQGSDPTGRPLLDVYPISEASLLRTYKPGSEPGTWTAKPKYAEHFLLPDNITVEADTKYGHATASGARTLPNGSPAPDYFMSNGFANAMDAAAENYTGATDPRSAIELMRARELVGLEGPTQAEAALMYVVTFDEAIADAKRSPEYLNPYSRPVIDGSTAQGNPERLENLLKLADAGKLTGMGMDYAMLNHVLTVNKTLAALTDSAKFSGEPLTAKMIGDVMNSTDKLGHSGFSYNIMRNLVMATARPDVGRAVFEQLQNDGDRQNLSYEEFVRLSDDTIKERLPAHNTVHHGASGTEIEAARAEGEVARPFGPRLANESAAIAEAGDPRLAEQVALGIEGNNVAALEAVRNRLGDQLTESKREALNRLIREMPSMDERQRAQRAAMIRQGGLIALGALAVAGGAALLLNASEASGAEMVEPTVTFGGSH